MTLPLPDAPRIETPRLIVRLVEEADLAPLMLVNGDEAVTRYLPYHPWKDDADARAWLERAGARLASGEAWQFVVVLRETQSAIGTCMLFRFDAGSARAELGYALGRAHWGAGLMREALDAFIAFAFGHAGLRRLEADIDPRNAASARLLERLGFVREGLLRERWQVKGEPSDAALYGLLRSDWARSV